MIARKNIIEMEPYVPGLQPKSLEGLVKLNTNENPYPPSPKVVEALKNLDYLKLRTYPDPLWDDLRAAIAENYGVKKENVCCGNGSDEIIAMFFRTFMEPGSTVVMPYPTYTLYKTEADIYDVRTQYVETNEDYTIDVEKLVTVSSSGMVIVNPNAPTGILLPVAQIEKLLKAYKGIVVVDEAYVDFAPEGASAISLIDKYDNLIVTRTFSKAYSLCGARVGYCFADKKLIDLMVKCKDIYNINYMSQLVATEAMKDQEYFKENIQKTLKTRKYLSGKLVEMGFKVYPSSSNFIFCSPPKGNAGEVYKYLVGENIYVRYYNAPRLSDKLRISVGTDAEVEVLLGKLRNYR